MSSRIRFLLLRSLPWLIGLTVGAAIVYLQKAGKVRTDREVLLQLPRSLPEGYSGTIGVRVFAYEAADSGNPHLIAPKATLVLHGPDGRVISVDLKPSLAGGLEATAAMPEPLRAAPMAARLEFELSGETHTLVAEVRVQPSSESSAGGDRQTRHVSGTDFMPRFGGCVAGRPCRNAKDGMKPWSEEKWKKLEGLDSLPRYAVAIGTWQLSGSPGESKGQAQLTLQSDSAIVVDEFIDGVWTAASSIAGPGRYRIEGDRVARYQFRPDPFDVGAASVFVFDPSDPGPSLETLARQEATVAHMPQMWSWNTQRKRDAVVHAKEAKTFFVLVVVLTALGAIGLLIVRWKSTRPRAGSVSSEDEKLLLGRTVTLVAGIFALVLLFLLAAALYLMRDFLGF